MKAVARITEPLEASALGVGGANRSSLGASAVPDDVGRDDCGRGGVESLNNAPLPDRACDPQVFGIKFQLSRDPAETDPHRHDIRSGINAGDRLISGVGDPNGAITPCDGDGCRTDRHSSNDLVRVRVDLDQGIRYHL